MSTQKKRPVGSHGQSEKKAPTPNPKPEPETLFSVATPAPDAETVADTAALFGVSVSTIRRLLAEEKLPGATKRKGPKGDEWVIPPADMTALGYRTQGAVTARFVDPQSRPAPTPQVSELTQLQTLLDTLRAELERTHEVALGAEVARHEAEVQALRAEVARQTELAGHERELRERADLAANLAATLAQQVREELVLTRQRVLELESPASRRRWFRKQTKPRQSEADPTTGPQNPL